MMKLLLVGIFLILAEGYALAQTVYDLNRAQFFWSWSQGTGGPVESFKLKCGTSPGNYTMFTTVPDPTARSFPVRQAIGGSGNYYCVITAVNAAGESPPSGETFFGVAVLGLPPGDFKVGY